MNNICLHEDTKQLGLEKSEETYKEWQKYWKALEVNKKLDGFLTLTHGSSNDWKNGDLKNLNTDLESNKKVSTASKAMDVNNGDIVDSNHRWVFALRHGERMDVTYGEWVPYCFDESGKYIRRDLNMPLTLPNRVGGKESYSKDTPLTRVGQLQAQLVGEGLRLAGVSVRYVYASAALRCVETAQALLNGLQPTVKTTKIRVEPGLFECKMWHLAKGLAPFMTAEELHQAGYDVDLSYKPYIDMDVTTTETYDEFYNRVEKVMQSAYRDSQQEGGNIVFVGHSTTLDMMRPAMKKLDLPNPSEQTKFEINFPVMHKIPYCGLAAMRNNPWQVMPPPCPSIMNSSNGKFDWTLLKDDYSTGM